MSEEAMAFIRMSCSPFGPSITLSGKYKITGLATLGKFNMRMAVVTATSLLLKASRKVGSP